MIVVGHNAEKRSQRVVMGVPDKDQKSAKTLWADRTAVDQTGDKFQSAP